MFHLGYWTVGMDSLRSEQHFLDSPCLEFQSDILVLFCSHVAYCNNVLYNYRDLDRITGLEPILTKYQFSHCNDSYITKLQFNHRPMNFYQQVVKYMGSEINLI